MQGVNMNLNYLENYENTLEQLVKIRKYTI